MVAIFEVFKAAVVLAAGFGILTLLGQDVQAAAENIVRMLHLDPARHYPRIFIEAASHVTDTRLKYMALFALLYSIIKLAEGYGLWYLKPWAEWFAIISGALYLPVEIYEIIDHATWLRAGILLVNALIVLYLIWVVRDNRRKRSSAATANPTPAT
jgi:uncharacterized membrane protein (DUF2068 family)